jgi:hypothetical protein
MNKRLKFIMDLVYEFFMAGKESTHWKHFIGLLEHEDTVCLGRHSQETLHY